MLSGQKPSCKPPEDSAAVDRWAAGQLQHSYHLCSEAAVPQETKPQCTQHTTDATSSSVFASAAHSVHDNSYDTADEKSALQTALTAARLTEQEAVSSAQRFEAELSDLAGAYNNLEVHSYQLEAQIKRLQNQAAQAPSTAGQTQACIAGQSLLQLTLLAAVPGSVL